MPYDTQVQLFQDQSDTLDGERGKQREGWPASKNNPTRSRWNLQKSEDAESDEGDFSDLHPSETEVPS